ncbi:MAG: hypothetical protein PHP70_10800 [Gallionella sp.]|nr:hypothetical protein [Gallionella sp.]
MIESILNLVSNLITPIVVWFIGRFKRPTVTRTRAPENIFEQLCPGTSLERMKEILGVPHRESKGQYSYSFSDALVQVRSNDSSSITTLAVALPKIKKRSHFAIHPMHFVLGKARLNEVLDTDSAIKKDNSSKHWTFWVRNYYGFPGLYRYYTFGVLEAPCLECPPFEWDHDKGNLKSDPKDITINWASVSGSSEDGEYFDFWAFV